MTPSSEHGAGLQKEGGDKLKKKLSRRASLNTETTERKSRRKKSSRRLSGLISASMPSIPSHLLRGNALERFNSLTLDEQIALKMAAKYSRKDDDSSSMNSSDSMDSGYEDGKICGENESKHRKCLTKDEQIHLKTKMAVKVKTREDIDSLCLLDSMDSGYDDEEVCARPPTQISISSGSNGEDTLGVSDLSLCNTMACDIIQRNSSTAAGGRSNIFAAEKMISRKLSRNSVLTAGKLNSAGSQVSAAQESYEQRLKKKLSTGSDGKKQLPKTWTCQKCTFMNKLESIACEMCHQSKSNGVAPIVWECKTCTYKENKLEALVCEVCSAARDGSNQDENNSRSVPDATPVPGHGSSGWQCKTCTYKENKLEALVCEVCSASRDGSNPDEKNLRSIPDATPAHGHGSSGWQCKACTYQENKLEALVCEVCSAARDDSNPDEKNSMCVPGAFAIPGPRWECKTCTFKENKLEDLVCEVCNAARDDSNMKDGNSRSVPDATSAHRHGSSGWQCKVCTYTNSDIKAIFCGACGSEC